MICAEGYKAFRGLMKVTPKVTAVKPFVEQGEWIYKPEYNCWYCGGRSFSADICEVILDETE